MQFICCHRCSYVTISLIKYVSGLKQLNLDLRSQTCCLVAAEWEYQQSDFNSVSASAKTRAFTPTVRGFVVSKPSEVPQKEKKKSIHIIISSADHTPLIATLSHLSSIICWSLDTGKKTDSFFNSVFSQFSPNYILELKL